MKISYKYKKKILSDTLTPIGVYLNLRDKYPETVMLESSDYHGKDHNYSYLGFDPIGGIKLDDSGLSIQRPGESSRDISLADQSLAAAIDGFLNDFEVDDVDLPFIHGGLFGYMTYDVVQYFEDLDFQRPATDIPLLRYNLFRYVLAFNHFNNELFIIKAIINDEDGGDDMENVTQLVCSRPSVSYPDVCQRR